MGVQEGSGRGESRVRPTTLGTTPSPTHYRFSRGSQQKLKLEMLRQQEWMAPSHLKAGKMPCSGGIRELSLPSLSQRGVRCDLIGAYKTFPRGKKYKVLKGYLI